MPGVAFEIPAVLRRYSAGRASVRVGAATAAEALETLLDELPALRPRVLDASGRVFPYLLLFRNGAALDRDTLGQVALADGDVLELIGAAEGGSGAAEGGSGADVRMRGFRTRVPVEEALAVALDGLTPRPAEDVHVTAAAGRVLARDVSSTVDVPAFRRSAMDG